MTGPSQAEWAQAARDFAEIRAKVETVEPSADPADPRWDEYAALTESEDAAASRLVALHHREAADHA